MVEKLPSAYARLSRWFPTLTDRACALGLSRETLTRWERASLDVEVRATTARRIDLVAQVAGLAARSLERPRDAGKWMLVPQPSLGGRSVAAAARDGDADAIRRLLALEPVTVASPISASGSDAFERGRHLPSTAPLPPTTRYQPRSRAKAALLDRAGAPPRLIGDEECP